MILRGLTLAALMLGLVPALSEGQAPPPAAKGVLKDVLFLKGDGKENAFAIELRLDGEGGGDLKALEADLARRLAEIEAMRAKIAEAKARAAAALKAKADARAKDDAKAKGGAAAGITITIHVSGGKAEEVEALIKKLKEAFGDKRVAVDPKRAERKVIVIGDKDVLRWGVPGIAPLPPGVPAPPIAVVPMPAPPRGKSVEDRIDALLKELDALRKELKATPAPKAPGLAR